MPPRIAVVYGTRPEAIKLAPVVEELRRRNVEPTIISTGQHVSLLRGTPAESTMAPHESLNLPSDNDPNHYAIVCGAALAARWGQDKPDLVLVQGDTASAYAGAWAAEVRKIPIAHVEAGIRSGDLEDPWPEENFRVQIDHMARWQFCPTLHAHNAMLWDKEDFRPDAQNAITGNSGIDALYSHTKPTTEVHDMVLITLHRRESFGEPLERIMGGIRRAAKEHREIAFIWPVHPNPEVQRIDCGIYVDRIQPLGAQAFAGWLSTSRAVITDSGGVQEEAAALGIPCIVAREKTDRPESVTAGIAKVVGRTEQGIMDGLDWALGFSTRPDPSTCFGDGHAAPRIVAHLLGN